MTLKTRIILLAIIALLIFLLGGFTGYWIKKCPQCEVESVRVEYRDSVAPNKEPVRVLVNGKITKVKARNFGGNLQSRVDSSIAQTGYLNTLRRATDSTTTLTCLDTNFYQSDTLSPENFKATTTAIVTGNELVDIKVIYKNLAPEKWRIETVTKTVVNKEVPSVVKVYAGAFGVGKQGYWGLGIKADVVLNDSYMIGYGFDAKNLSHQAELLIKIKLK